VADGILDFKLALPRNKLDQGEFHDKFGVFTDTEGNQISFNGSYNDSIQGTRNYESIKIFCSWHPVLSLLVDADASRFESLWHNKDPNVEVYDLPEAAHARIVHLRKMDRPYPVPDSKKLVMLREDKSEKESQYNIKPSIPNDVELRDYQNEAINNWFKNNGRGTLKMATGSGKTIVGLAIASRLYEKLGLEALLIVCPYRHLVTQWQREARKFGIEPLLAFESRKKWVDWLTANLSAKAYKKGFLTVITTNATFTKETFQTKLKYFPKKTLLIADEVHNLGAKHLREALPDNIKLRLGLSATPERWFDDAGSEAIFNYFGPVLEPQFTLKDALEKKALVPYRYYPILVYLTDAEIEQYLAITAKIGQLLAGKKVDEDDPAMTSLLTQRSRLVAVASNKLDALRELMSKKSDDSHMLFYCGDGSVEEESSKEVSRHVDVVCKLLGSELGFRVDTYTAETPLEERESLRERLDSGELQGLVAIRCLDEGVDIPSIKSAVILASSSNPRQFIQRRGRILRPAHGKESAEIFDMIVVPPVEGVVSDTQRNLMRKELKRFAEFADLALNSGDARAKIIEIQKQFDLFDI